MVILCKQVLHVHVFPSGTKLAIPCEDEPCHGSAKRFLLHHFHCWPSRLRPTSSLSSSAPSVIPGLARRAQEFLRAASNSSLLSSSAKRSFLGQGEALAHPSVGLLLHAPLPPCSPRVLHPLFSSQCR